MIPDWMETEVYGGLSYPKANIDGCWIQCPYVCFDEGFYTNPEQMMRYPQSIRVYDPYHNEHLYLKQIDYKDINDETSFLSVDFRRDTYWKHIIITRWCHYAKDLENNLIFFNKIGDKMVPTVYPEDIPKWDREMLAPYFIVVSRSGSL